MDDRDPVARIRPWPGRGCCGRDRAARKCVAVVFGCDPDARVARALVNGQLVRDQAHERLCKLVGLGQLLRARPRVAGRAALSLRPRDLAAAAQASPDLARHLDRREAPGPGCEQGTGLPSNLAREPARSRPSRASHPLGCRLRIAARSDRLSARGRPVLVRVCAVHDAKRAKCNETLRPGGGDATQLSSSAP